MSNNFDGAAFLESDATTTPEARASVAKRLRDAGAEDLIDMLGVGE